MLFSISIRLSYAQRVVGYAPDVGKHWSTLGAVQYRLGNWPEALKAREKAAELSDDDTAAILFSAMTNWQLGNKEAARNSYDEAVASMEKKKPEDPALNRIEKEAAVLQGISAKDESGG